MKWDVSIDITNNPKILILCGRVAAFSSVIWIMVAGFFIVNRLMFLPGTVSTTGTIVSCQFDSKGTCSPTVSFITQSGQKITFTSSSASSSYSEGVTLPIKYHPNTPQDVRIDDFTAIWLAPLLGSGGFLLWIFMGLYMWRRGIKLRARGLG